jgi:hypothetical protein
MTDLHDHQPLMIKCLEFSCFIAGKLSAANTAGPAADGFHDLDLTPMCEWWAAHFTTTLSEDLAEQLTEALAGQMSEHHPVEELDCITWEFAHSIHHCYEVAAAARRTQN